MKQSLHILLLLFVLGALHSWSAVLYTTDFDSFTVGTNQWAGTDGWIGNATGVSGIDGDIIPALDNTAFLGFSQPAQTLNTLYRPVNLDPVAAGTPVVRFESLLGIQDSENNRRDTFLLTVYNIAGDPLAALRFDNRTASFGIWRLNGSNGPGSAVDTGIDFIRNELQLVAFEIDYAANTWSADLDGIPLFSDAPFTASSSARTFGGVAAEWQVASFSPALHGDNWLLIADWKIETVDPAGPEEISSLQITGGAVTLTWTPQQTGTYQVEYRNAMDGTDLNSVWLSDLPGSSMAATAGVVRSFTDTASAVRRFYRVRRL